MDLGRWILALVLTNLGTALLIVTALRTLFPRSDDEQRPLAAAVQYAAGLACVTLGAGLLGWLW